MRAPGPGHSVQDRSMTVKLEPTAPDGILVFSHSGDDVNRCRDHVRKRLGLDSWKPRKGNGSASAKQLNRKRTAKAQDAARPPKPFSDLPLIRDGYRRVCAYAYRSATDSLLYEVLRYEHPEKPKRFLQR